MQLQRIVRSLPRPLRRHKVIRALTFVFPRTRLQPIRYNEVAQAWVDLSDGDARTIAIDAEFDREFFTIARPFLREHGVCFDVGANYGLCSFGLVPSHSGVEYHLFEANPALWPILKRSLGLNAPTRIHLVEGAVGERTGETSLFNEPDQTSGQMYIRPGGGIRTRLLTLDEYIAGAGVKRVDFTKMDIEGYELFALAGAQQSIDAGKLPVLYFELKAPLAARFGKTVSDVLQMFRSSGYRLFHVREQDFNALGLAPDCDIRGLRAAEVRNYPETLWTDLLAIHRSVQDDLVSASTS